MPNQKICFHGEDNKERDRYNKEWRKKSLDI